MPDRDTDAAIFSYPLARMGINFNKNILGLNEEEALQTKNCIWKNGIIKRGGQAKFEDDEVDAGKKIVGLTRFYFSTASKQLLVASGTTNKYHDGATWQDIKTGLTDGAQTFFETWLDSSYIANVSDAPHKWDGSSDSAVGAAPADTRMFLAYQDRLLSITGGDLTWSASFDDSSWESVANVGVRPDTQLFGMIHHSATNVDAGYEAKILLAGANGMYIFSGTDLRVPSTTGDYTIFPLATSIGCNAPRTMVWTPHGTMYLGIDRQVYLLPFKSSVPVPIGTKIQSQHSGVEGIEKMPSGQISEACAVYHDGYYKLSIAQSGRTINNAQFWLDVDRLHQDEDTLWGPWYGPMEGQTISVYASQNGNGDIGELMAGEDDATVGSFVYQVGELDTFSDDGTAIDVNYQTYFNPLGEAAYMKVVNHAELEILDVLGTVNVDFLDITGVLKTGDTVPLSGSAIFWDDLFWDEFFWSSSAPTRARIDITPAIRTRRLSILVKHSSGDDKFEMYGLSTKAIEGRLEFQQ